MGTRADFYIGRGVNAEWIGSIAWDGYPSGVHATIRESTTEQEFRDAVSVHMSKRDDWTNPDQGWPWPWTTSHTTDYAYAFDDGCVWTSRFGDRWFNAKSDASDERDVVFPDMTDRQNVDFGKRSGTIIVGI